MRLSSLFLVSLSIDVARATLSHCSGLEKSTCTKDGCIWVGTGNSGSCEENHESAMVVCVDRKPADCEEDDLCTKVKGACMEVNRGSGTEGDDCAMTLEDDGSGHSVYSEVDNQGCQDGFVCIVADSYSDTTVGAVIPGTCQPTTCYGRKVAGSCAPSKPGCGGATNRTTICHRTCSETNPWVRITIDDDAWATCGHMQHTTDTCNGKDLTKWGANRNDYIIMKHGTRDSVATKLENDPNAIKEYWRQWEHACPYVRNGECCDWTDENPCCGDKPGTTTPPGPTPTVGPTLPPVPTPPPDCPMDQEELYAINGVTLQKGNSLGNFKTTDEFPVKVLSTDGKKVTFQVCNKVGNGLVFTGFMQNGEYVCFESDETVIENCVTYTADCYVSEPFAVVDIHLTDPKIDPPTVDVPKCCHDDEVDPKSAVYVFLLKCECPAQEV